MRRQYHSSRKMQWCQVAVKVAAGADPGGAAAAAAADGRSRNDVDEEDETENPCPVCLDNEDDATVDGNLPGMCVLHVDSLTTVSATRVALLTGHPTAQPAVQQSVSRMKRLSSGAGSWSTTGRHTPEAQNGLATMYSNGEGVKQDYRDHGEAVNWFRKSAEAGFTTAQCNLGVMHSVHTPTEKVLNKTTSRQSQVVPRKARKAERRPMQGLQRCSATSVSFTSKVKALNKTLSLWQVGDVGAVGSSARI